MGSIPGEDNFLPVSSSLLLHRSSLFWCCFDMSSPEDTQTTEGSQEVPLTNSLKHAAACRSMLQRAAACRSMPQHAAASQNCLGDHWCLSEARGSVSVGFWGSCQLSPLGGGGLEGSIDPPPPEVKARLPLCLTRTTTSRFYSPSTRPEKGWAGLQVHKVNGFSSSWFCLIIERVAGTGRLAL